MRRVAAVRLPRSFLGDEAPWIWELQRVFFPLSIDIVDFHHTAEHVTRVVDLIEDHRSPAGRKLRRRWIKLLLRGKIDAFMSQTRAAFALQNQAKREKELGYFERNRKRMRYDQFREQGYFSDPVWSRRHAKRSLHNASKDPACTGLRRA